MAIGFKLLILITKLVSHFDVNRKQGWKKGGKGFEKMLINLLFSVCL